jgi:3-hydroxyacyl-[acyl-carrier-protein] dehydratase
VDSASPLKPEKLLPHGKPFRFVDNAELVDERHVTASRTVPMTEPWTDAHFPGDPIVPGVLLLEGMAQTCGLLLRAAGPAETRPRVGRLAAVRDARFHVPVRPGDTLRYDAELQAIVTDGDGGSVSRFRASATVRDLVVAEAALVLALVPSE